MLKNPNALFCLLKAVIWHTVSMDSATGDDVDIAWPRELTVEVVILNIITHIPNVTGEASPTEVSEAQKSAQLIKHVSIEFAEQELNLHAAKVKYDLNVHIQGFFLCIWWGTNNAIFIVVAGFWWFLQNNQKFKKRFRVLLLTHIMPKISTLPPISFCILRLLRLSCSVYEKFCPAPDCAPGGTCSIFISNSHCSSCSHWQTPQNAEVK